MSNQKNIWGITGNMGMGKTELCNILGEKANVRVFNCDKIAKSLVKVDESIFEDPVKLKEVEDFVHPKVWEYITKQIEIDDKDIYIIESAIIFEIGWDKKIPNIIVVKRSVKTQSERLRYQWPNELKEERATIVVENEGTIEELREKAEKLYSIISQKLPEGRIVL